MKPFLKQLFTWYSRHQRPLPWRQTSNPYHVLVSEIMLQQTQVSRVREKFPSFLQQFPSLAQLAQASKAEVITAWSGMGYNRRALLLQRFAQEVLEKHNGKIPADPAVLRTLPGIGPYTAGALAAFAYNKPEPAIDVNIRSTGNERTKFCSEQKNGRSLVSMKTANLSLTGFFGEGLWSG